MTNVQDYLLPELQTLQASLNLDMSSRTAEKYTYYVSSLRDIIRHLPDEWSSTTRSFVSCHPYCGPQEILRELEAEMLVQQNNDRQVDVLESISSFARLLLTIQDNVAESLRA